MADGQQSGKQPLKLREGPAGVVERVRRVVHVHLRPLGEAVADREHDVEHAVGPNRLPVLQLQRRQVHHAPHGSTRQPWPHHLHGGRVERVKPLCEAELQLHVVVAEAIVLDEPAKALGHRGLGRELAQLHHPLVDVVSHRLCHQAVGEGHLPQRLELLDEHLSRLSAREDTAHVPRRGRQG